MGNGRAARRKIMKNQKPDEKLRAAQAQANQAQMSLLNMRHLYEKAVQEKLIAERNVDLWRTLTAALIYPDEYAWIPNEKAEAIANNAVLSVAIERKENGDIALVLTFPEDDDDDEE